MKKPEPNRECSICGKKFHRFLSQIKLGVGKYCSKECQNIGMKTRLKVSCKNCGKEYLVAPSEIKRGTRKYCSHKCKGVAIKGEKHYLWKGGKSAYPDTFNFDFKRTIRERDNYTCMICGAPNSRIVHHVDYNKENTTEENCVTVCNSCHSRTNYNREWWRVLLKTRMYYEYGEIAKKREFALPMSHSFC